MSDYEVIKDFRKHLNRQTKKGIKEYGVPLSESKLPILTLIEYTKEELVDAYAYIHEVEKRLNNLFDELEYNN